MELYVGAGLFAWLPAGTELTESSTDDPIPHAEAGAVFVVDGQEVEIWRALFYGTDEVDSALGRSDSGVAVFVRAADPDRERCVLAGLRYDAARDVD